jgi:hypothetical protein
MTDLKEEFEQLTLFHIECKHSHGGITVVAQDYDLEKTISKLKSLKEQNPNKYYRICKITTTKERTIFY